MTMKDTSNIRPKKRYHYTVEVVYREEFVVEADTKEEADGNAQDMFDDRDGAVWDAILKGDPDSNRLIYEGFSASEDSAPMGEKAGETCLTVHPKERRAGSWG